MRFGSIAFLSWERGNSIGHGGPPGRFHRGFGDLWDAPDKSLILLGNFIPAIPGKSGDESGKSGMGKPLEKKIGETVA
jgi:hypothetical protein